MKEIEDIKQLPKDWKWEILGEVCEFSQGIQIDIHRQYQDKNNGLVRFLRIIDFTQDDEPPRYINYPGNRYLLKKDDIAMVRYGTVGFVCTGKEGIIANNLFKIIPTKFLDKKYLINFLNSHLFKGKLKTKGATMQALSFGMIKPIPVPLPPLPIQYLIVAKIEELFSELDKGIENLRLAQQQLKTYRQAVLKWAFEGRLTNDDVKEGELPEGWRWVKSGELFDFVTSGSRGWAKYYSDKGAIFIRITNLDFDSLDLDLEEKKIQYVNPPSDSEGIRTKVHEGDFLFSITGYLGMFAIAPNLNNAFVNQHISLCRPKSFFDKKFVGYWIISKAGGHLYLNKMTKGATKAGLGLDDIKNFPVPIAPIDVQHLIVQAIESRLSVADKMEEDITQSLEQAEALRQSILKKAFEGRLV